MDLILHGHFYQPPRENPWTDEIGREPGARPYGDWNERVDAECYRPNGFGRVMDDHGGIAGMINNYAWLSFNFGPTLLRWLKRHDPLTLGRLVLADADSRRRLGHGNAIAQAYNHIIMPLADARDRSTQIRWGLAAFRHTFGREAEALWLPETAASKAVLDDLIDHGMRWVMLAPRQAARVRPPAGEWQDVSGGRVDTSRAYLHRHGDGSGRSVAIMLYDGALARSIAFGRALDSSGGLARHCREAGKRMQGPLLQAAFDGETAGHHHAWGDRALAHAFLEELPAQGFSISNPGAFLDRHPADWEVELEEGPDGEGSSWSCAHGVGRWRRDCGCRIDQERGWSQAWRAPLRTAVERLRDRAAAFFTEAASPLLADPWAARDDYVQVVLAPGEASRRELLQRHGTRAAGDEGGVRALELLELQHHVMLAATSCGWFFDDIGGLEATQVLRYMAFACHLWDGLGGDSPRDELREILGEARSNVPSRGTGADILDRVQARDGLAEGSLAAHVMVRAGRGLQAGGIAGHDSRVEDLQARELGAGTLATAVIGLQHRRTGRRRRAGAALLERPASGVRVALVKPGDVAGLWRELNETSGQRPEDWWRRRFGDHDMSAEDLARGGGHGLLAPTFEADVENLRRRLAASSDGRAMLPREIVALGLAAPPGMASALAAWQIEAILERHAQGPIPEDEVGVDEARRLARSALGRRGAAWLRCRVERLVAARMEAWGEEQGDGVLRLLQAMPRLGLRPDWFRAQEAFQVAVLEGGAGPGVTGAAREVGLALGFAPSLLDGAGVSAPALQAGEERP